MLPLVRTPCVPVFEDNEGAVELGLNPVTNSNSKHIDTQSLPLVAGCEGSDLHTMHVRSTWQHADFLTNPLSAEALQFSCNLS